MRPADARDGAEETLHIYRILDDRVFEAGFDALITATVATTQTPAGFDPTQDQAIVNAKPVDFYAGWFLTSIFSLLNWMPVVNVPAGLRRTDGDLPGFRNWDNEEHMNVDPSIVPHWAPPTHAMQIFRYCETGSIRMLWIQATNPAVSMPNLPRMRKILANGDLFVVVQLAATDIHNKFAA